MRVPPVRKFVRSVGKFNVEHSTQQYAINQLSIINTVSKKYRNKERILNDESDIFCNLKKLFQVKELVHITLKVILHGGKVQHVLQL